MRSKSTSFQYDSVDFSIQPLAATLRLLFLLFLTKYVSQEIFWNFRAGDHKTNNDPREDLSTHDSKNDPITEEPLEGSITKDPKEDSINKDIEENPITEDE